VRDNRLAGESSAVVFLMGATACGKTDLSLALADVLNAEIISVDSALVYRGLDIGTAKPSARERALVPHHLIDVSEPWHSYSAAQFCNDACRAIDDIQSRGKHVLLVGGTMLYFKALEEGLADLPDADAAIRSSLMQEASVCGWPAMHSTLAAKDPVAASRIHPNDPQRIQRALEVYYLTGKPMSQLQSNTRSPLARKPIKYALMPDNRSWLHERIQRRFQGMVAQGFMDEVRRLRADERIHSQLPSMRSVGYRQAWDYLDREEAGELDQDWINKAVAATRQLAKRQLTWLRGMREVNVLACDTLSTDEQIERFICTDGYLGGQSR
jgi:tRNA dimethylallyltransferase